MPKQQSEVASPQDLNKYPGLLPELGQLFQRLQRDVKFPPERKESRLLPLLPESTTLFAAFPNYGEASRDALTIFQAELQRSSVLRDWWTHGDMAATGPEIEAELAKFQQLSQYLGDEIVVAGDTNGTKTSSMLVLAEVKKAGLKEFLQGMMQDLPSKKQVRLRLLDVQDLAAAKEKSETEDLLILVRPDFVVAAVDVNTLRKFNARLGARQSGFASSPYGRRLLQAYENSVTVLAAADLQRIIQQFSTDMAKNQLMLDRSGFGDAKYLVFEHNRVSGQPTSQMELSFNGPRHGIASWLAAPAPMGSLSFVSPQAMIAGGVLLKSPAEIFEDIRALANDTNRGNAFASIEPMERGLNLSLKEDVLRPLSGEIAYEISRITQSNAVWKIILRVNDPDHLQRTLNTLMATAPVSPQQSEEGGVTYHTLQIPSGQKPTEIAYAFVDGYLIVASSRETAVEAVRRHVSGDSLAKSRKFLDSLPPGELAQFSGVFYEEPTAMAALNMQRISPGMTSILSQAGTDSAPVVLCGYGEARALREASRSAGADAGAIMVIAAVAIPNLLRSRVAANESTALGSVRTVNTAQVTYSAAYPQRGFAHDLATLGPGTNAGTESANHAGIIDASLGGPTCTAGNWCIKSGYRFSVATVCRAQKCNQYVVVATPVSADTGSKSFCSTSDTVIHFKVGPPLSSMIRASECRTWPAIQ